MINLTRGLYEDEFVNGFHEDLFSKIYVATTPMSDRIVKIGHNYFRTKQMKKKFTIINKQKSRTYRASSFACAYWDLQDKNSKNKKRKIVWVSRNMHTEI
jgi:hypothetical protein